ncbi:50S ribosomal protein L20 [Candidatus Gottesmanbacteria bacterium RIFCSPHIGHO2_02_FULL_39_11]|uniref:Large ribosomal subunit protein bL20 n=1 Tax=Candidatus Gottesmanbacteria bacterium RIFCSPHIGHO2_02_FULL_39_11 TaxID=1798382 RepID=A0A1F5ZUB2_9BACT|nr:MAG: 50S ribosomal protein L20 [Candidatus Gottesmanbacteria bacterium RIFCSPHIGHO2_02_FULL_39_11]
MRVKRGVVSRRKHNKLLGSVKGYRMTKRRLVRVAKEASLHAGQYAFAGRRKKKSDFRSLWIVRISEALKNHGINYSEFISKMKKANITLDRKILSNLLITDTGTFNAIVDKVKNS